VSVSEEIVPHDGHCDAGATVGFPQFSQVNISTARVDTSAAE